MNSWLDGDVPISNTRPGKQYDQAPNIIIAHLSGLDSVGHRYGVKDSAEYAEKLRWLDDNFATIVAAVEEGRRIYDNIRKFFTYTMTSNAGEIWVMLIAPLIGMPFALLPQG